jgi:hypothetical protein
MKTLAKLNLLLFRKPTEAPLLRAIPGRSAAASSLVKADALSVRRSLLSACLAFISFVAAMLTTIPEWTSPTCDISLAVCLVSFAGSVAFLLRALAAFTPVNRVYSTTPATAFSYQYFWRQ